MPRHIETSDPLLRYMEDTALFVAKAGRETFPHLKRYPKIGLASFER